MSKYDLIVVGGGFAGLFSAIIAGRAGLKVKLLTHGAGTLTVGGGVVDLLGYHNIDSSVQNPYDGIDQLAIYRDKNPHLNRYGVHPYLLVGKQRVREAMEYFKKFTDECAFPYISSGDENIYLPTAIGTLKPTFLHSCAECIHDLERAEKVYIIAVEGMKDFYPEVLASGLKKQGRKLSGGYKYKDKVYEIKYISNPFHAEAACNNRDIVSLDIANYYDSDEGKRWFISELKRILPISTANAGETDEGVVDSMSVSDVVAISAPILGTRPIKDMYKDIKTSTGVNIIEIPVMPPSVSGLRLRHLLLEELKRLNITVVEMANVTSFKADGDRCTSVLTQGADRVREYSADRFIIATGGFFGGGVVAEPGRAYEKIFKIELDVPPLQSDWSYDKMFCKEQHLFGLMGVPVNNEMKAITASGDIIYRNVHFVGRTVGGYDFNSEKSGNGVAIVSSYVAVNCAIKDMRAEVSAMGGDDD